MGTGTLKTVEQVVQIGENLQKTKIEKYKYRLIESYWMNLMLSYLTNKQSKQNQYQLVLCDKSKLHDSPL